MAALTPVHRPKATKGFECPLCITAVPVGKWIVICNMCNGEACRDCMSSWIKECGPMVKCFNCREEWGALQIVASFGASYYKKLLVEQARAEMELDLSTNGPATLSLVTKKREIEEADGIIDALSHERAKVSNSWIYMYIGALNT